MHQKPRRHWRRSSILSLLATAAVFSSLASASAAGATEQPDATPDGSTAGVSAGLVEAGAKPVCPQPAAVKNIPLEPRRAMSEYDPHAEASIVSGALPPGVALSGSMAAASPYAFTGKPTSEGTYAFTLRITLTDSARRSVACTMTVRKAPTAVRIEGADRYDQAALVSASSFSSAETVYLASGESFADALSAGAVAGIHGSPLLLTAATSLPDPTRAELARLRPDDVVVVGGPASVSPSVVASIEGAFAGTTVTRISGADRYAGSRALLQHPEFGAPASPWLYLATGASFPDALAASPAAISLNAPVLLVDGSKSAASSDELALFKSLRVTDIRIAGGPASVSSALEGALRSGPWAVSRVSGADRYAGAVALNKVFDSAPTVFFASGAVFPDALSGAPAAGHQGAPVYLVADDCVPHSVLRDVARVGATKVIVLGGRSTLSAAIEKLTPC
ncbi:cell wall-binding repeat-containing protein [Herbiconiux moechotypicola]|uniref:Cell wall-binding repeat-containing protein n=1 Tax=Herbiconiux moechotypicola TaxID=637393 RepID=A0ABN3DQ30_9MICO|nr:cell wall-binding repeat-containing protein [Herbiconiux moechotypicola]MCS5731734.1 cell wall-binding repeat-containing protein [Herbiconiux moechotypicola]